MNAPRAQALPGFDRPTTTSDGALWAGIAAGECAEGVELCVLASGSGGNCSVLSIKRAGVRRLCLIDVGLSPRRTVRLLAGLGLGMHQVDDVVVTHLDTDHFYSGWARAVPGHARLRMHHRHAEQLGLFGRGSAPFETFDDGFELRDGTPVRAVLAAHDEAGVAAFRFELDGGRASLGFATDIGRATDQLVSHLRGVDVLAIESNYCPAMQEASDRPIFLKRRIMGGSGHLSNHQALDAIGRIGPREHVVLLHLSRQCNNPALVASLHDGSSYGLTITDQFQPTRWVPVGAGAVSRAQTK